MLYCLAIDVRLWSQENMSTPRTRREREIWEACDTLLTDLGEVKAVTGDKIMHQLLDLGYKKGCANEIYKYRRSWWELRGISEAEAKGIVKTTASVQSFSDPIKRAVSIVQEELQMEANRQIESLTQSYQEEVSRLKEQHDSITKTVSTLKEKNHQLQSVNDNLTTAIHKKTSELDEVKRSLDLLQTTLKEKENVIVELNQQTQRHITEIKEQSQERLNEKDHYIADLKSNFNETLNHIKSTMEANRHDHILEKDKLKTELDKLKHQSAQKDAQLQTMQEDNERSDERYKTLEHELLKLKADQTELNHIKQGMDGLLQSLSQQSTDMGNIHLGMTKIIAKLFRKELQKSNDENFQPN